MPAVTDKGTGREASLPRLELVVDESDGATSMFGSWPSLWQKEGRSTFRSSSRAATWDFSKRIPERTLSNVRLHLAGADALSMIAQSPRA